MYKSMCIIGFVFLFSCCSEQSEHKNILPAPPNAPKKYEIHYKGKIFEMNEEEHRRFLDSLEIKDTVIKKIS
jgi:hypothetical protein